jgi:ATP-dependent DNA helicase RecQ
MKEPIFIDIEATARGNIKELGIVYGSETLRTSSIKEALQAIQSFSTNYIAGHNFIDFDKKLLEKTSLNHHLSQCILLDTLPISLLLFNEKTFHSLPKNYKTEDCFVNNPVKDAQLSQDLFRRSISKFLSLPTAQQSILFSLLKDQEKFVGFFTLLATKNNIQFLSPEILYQSIAKEFAPIIKNNQELGRALAENPVELAYILAIRVPELEVNAQPPKILYDYPGITRLQERLCFSCDEAIKHMSPFALENFGFDTFREFPRQNATLFTGAMVSQREIMEAALKQQSIIAILPTGGGKTFTFWLPALVKAQALKTLTVVISPLQALIKDQMESFQEQLANYTAVALSGYLSPSEHADAVDKVVNGDADLLYLAPESLRSNRVFNILKNRVIERFVIDEAHCLSTWGNDFRHDYFYIGSFINDLLEAKPFQSHILRIQESGLRQKPLG